MLFFHFPGVMLCMLTCMTDLKESLGSGTTDTLKNGDTPYTACKRCSASR